MEKIISPKRLIKIASKWQKRDAVGRNKNSSPRVANNNMMNNMAKLFKMSEEEFGLSSGSGTIILPCDSLFMNYMVSLLQRGMTGDLEKALLANSLFSSSCSSSTLIHQGQTRNPTIPLWLLLSI
ncbi:hypothetical protein L3X38_037809 [Prunus dulcis]|uniref:SAUR-like auxin-responsive protein family n=1 Tax=Prunus dulcis TaxID=3755 RepID=A0AAD4V5C2_PRUDU|nr:hypothetical protein L3X38_037809 [Prunus dulcis]